MTVGIVGLGLIGGSMAKAFSEAEGIPPVIVGRVVYSVFIVGIRIIRGCLVIQKILEELFKIVITWLVVELQ